MSRMLFLLSLVVGASVPALAGSPEDEAARHTRNWDVLLSNYPPAALAAGEEGQVGFKVIIDSEGYATACEVTHSSGYSRLDNETCQLVVQHATFKGIKDASRRKASSIHEGVVNWKLPTRAAGEGAPVKTADSRRAPEKIICKRQVRTGSLASFERTCGTKADWQRRAERDREQLSNMQGKKGHTNGGD